MKKCLYCYEALGKGEKDFHAKCSKKFFGSETPPELPYTRKDIDKLAKKIIQNHTTIGGVQPKLSLNIDKAIKQEQRLTIVGLWGQYILKPQTKQFKNLPENEDMSMHLAKLMGIDTVPHSLIRFADGELCYITKRIDRTKSGEKIPMEDMAQLTLHLSEEKYKSSYERISKIIREYSLKVGFDLSAFAEQVLFSWLIGNSDMHLKNFSLYKPKDEWRFTPAYDMLNVKLAMPKDEEELAMVLNGKGGSHKFKRDDFKKAFLTFGLNDKAVENIFDKFKSKSPDLLKFLKKGFLPAAEVQTYKTIIEDRISRL